MNNIRFLSSLRPFTLSFVYIDIYDGQKYLADQIFINNKIKVFYIDEMINPLNPNYAIMICRIYRWDVKKLLNCMPQIRNKMFLLGYTDYDEQCNQIFNSIELYG